MALLKILATDGTPSREVELSGPAVVIGRDAGCDVVIAGEGVSRRHARLVASDKGWELLDLDSRNGVWVDGQRIQRHLLRPGETIELGTVSLRFASGSDEALTSTYATPPSPSLAPAPAGHTCSRCGHGPLGAEVRFCPRCGASTAGQPTFICPNPSCAAPVIAGALFCPACGVSLAPPQWQKAAPADAAQAAAPPPLPARSIGAEALPLRPDDSGAVAAGSAAGFELDAGLASPPSRRRGGILRFFGWIFVLVGLVLAGLALALAVRWLGAS